MRERFGIHYQFIPLAAELVLDVLLLAAEIGGAAVAVTLVTGNACLAGLTILGALLALVIVPLEILGGG